jgi:hypothetical protein
VWEGRKKVEREVGDTPKPPAGEHPCTPFTLILNFYARAITGILNMDIEAVDDVWSYGL